MISPQREETFPVKNGRAESNSLPDSQSGCPTKALGHDRRTAKQLLDMNYTNVNARVGELLDAVGEIEE
jgi:hypothetical protein